jgi:hypothetical protein
MSVLESSDRAFDLTRFTRWPGLLSLALGVLLGPVVALVNQSTTYAATMWACGHGARATLHVIPALCLLVVLGALGDAHRNWCAIGRGLEDEHEPIVSRVRFLSLLGIAISVFSALIIIAQWGAIFVFSPCQRA